MRNTFTLGLMAFIALSACGSKKMAAEKPASEKQEDAPLKTSDGDKKACELPWGLPEKEKENKRNYAYMAQNYKANDMETAYKFWALSIDAVPCANINIYKIGEAIFDHFLNKEKDPAMRKKYILDMNRNFKLRQQYFGEEEVVSARWGRSLYDFDSTSYTQIMTLLDKAIDLNGDTTETFVMFAYLNTAFRAYNAKVLDNDDMFNTYNKLTDIVEKNIEVNAEDSTELGKWNALQSQLDVIIDQVGTCADLISQYQPRMAESGEDIIFLNKIEKSLRAKRCTKEPLYIAVLEKLNNLTPTIDVALRLANYYYGSGNNLTKANQYMEKVIGLENDNGKNSDRYVSMASKALKAGNSAAARNYNDRALDLNPNNGYALLLKANLLYKNIRASCTDAFDKGAAAWVAMDYCARARAADPRVSAQASRSYNNYAAGAPSNEACFMRSLQKGSSYTLKCVGITTTVK